MEYSTHAKIRMQQRGFSGADLELICRFGERVGDGFVLTNKSIDMRTRELKREIQRIEHLRNACVIEDKDQAITAMKLSDRSLRRRRYKKRGRTR